MVPPRGPMNSRPSDAFQITDSVKLGFPRPLARLRMGQVWLAEDVEAWVREHRPKLAEEPEGE